MQDITKEQMKQVATDTVERMDEDEAKYMLAGYYIAEYEKDINRYHENAISLIEDRVGCVDRYCVKCGYPVISDDMDDSEVADLFPEGEQLCEACEDGKLEQDNA